MKKKNNNNNNNNKKNKKRKEEEQEQEGMKKNEWIYKTNRLRIRIRQQSESTYKKRANKR